MAHRKFRASRPRTIIRRVSRSVGGLGGIRSMANKVLVGLGCVSAASMIAPRVGVDPRIVGGALGFLSGGVVPALVAVATPSLLQAQTAPREAVVGQVWA